MNGQEIIKTEKTLLKIEYLPSLNYSMLNNGVETCSKCILKNVGREDWHQIQIRVNGKLMKEHTQHLEFLRKGQSVQINNLIIQPDIKRLSEITETINTILDMMLQKGDIREVNGMLSFNA